MRALSLVLLLVIPQASALDIGPGIHVRQVAAPPQPLSGVKSLTVGKFSGTFGSLMSEQLTTALGDAERALPEDSQMLAKGAAALGAGLAAGAASALTFGLAAPSAYTAVNDAATNSIESKRVQLDDGLTIMPMKLGSKGDATISGSVTERKEEASYTKTESRTENGYTYEVKVLCMKRSVSVDLAWTIVDKGGKELASAEETLRAADDRCDADVSNLSSTDALVAYALRGKGLTIANNIAPAWRTFRVDLDTDKTVKDAVKLATKDGDRATAACQVKAVYDADAKNAVAAYDLGAFAEAGGHLDAAQGYYEAAIKAKKHKGAEKALARLETRRAELAALEKAWGMKYSISPEVDWSGCAG